MYVKLDKDTQSSLLRKAIFKAGSERKLRTLTGISCGMIYHYRKCVHRMPYSRFKILLNFLGMKENEVIFELIDEKEYLSKGGKAVYAKYLQSGRFDSIHQKMRKASSSRMKKWHKEMREQNLKLYHELQYSRFKKIAGYKTETKKGHLVRNTLEKMIADALFDAGIAYEYEPFVFSNGSPYFPDFLAGSTIIECTAWKGESKSKQLAKKILDFEAGGFEVIVVVPKALASIYKLIEKNIIYQEELVVEGLFNRRALEKKATSSSA